MSDEQQLFSASLAKDAVYRTGLRSFMEYRDLGIEKATHGRFRGHVIRVKKGSDVHDLHTTGLHQHHCDFQSSSLCTMLGAAARSHRRGT